MRSTPAKLQIPPLTWHRPMPSLIAGWPPSLISPTMASAAKASGIWFTTAVNFHPFRLVYRARTLAASLRELMLACSLLASQGRACCNSYLVSIQDNPIRATSEHLPQTTGTHRPIDPQKQGEDVLQQLDPSARAMQDHGAGREAGSMIGGHRSAETADAWNNDAEMDGHRPLMRNAQRSVKIWHIHKTWI